MAAIENIPQLTGEQLATMTPEQIHAAHRAGQLAELLGAPIPVRLVDNGEQVTTEELRRLSPEQVTRAQEAGRLANLLGPQGDNTAACPPGWRPCQAALR